VIQECCFYHSTCVYNKCLEHNPLQKVSVECATNLLLNKQIVDKEDYSSYVQTFYFSICDGNKVPLSITNNLIQYMLMNITNPEQSPPLPICI
jgi:hypothetical protein